jgi:hypothetical protein
MPNTTAHDDATTWRDLAGQLTPDQIATLEDAERRYRLDAMSPPKWFPPQLAGRLVASPQGTGRMQQLRRTPAHRPACHRNAALWPAVTAATYIHEGRRAAVRLQQ